MGLGHNKLNNNLEYDLKGFLRMYLICGSHHMLASWSILYQRQRTYISKTWKARQTWYIMMYGALQYEMNLGVERQALVTYVYM